MKSSWMRFAMVRWFQLIIAMACFQLSATVHAGFLDDLTDKVTARTAQKKQWPYPVKAAGYWVFDCDPCMAWLDNDRVLFNGFHPDNIWRKAPLYHSDVELTKLYVWDTRKNIVTVHAETYAVPFCLSDDQYLFYKKPGPEGYIVEVEGIFGEETERLVKRLTAEEYREEKAQRLKDRTLIERNRFTCREDRIFDYPGEQLTKLILRPGDGVLYWGKGHSTGSREERQKPLHYFPSGSKKPKELPIPRWEVDGWKTAYSAFNDKYVAWGIEVWPGQIITPWPKDRPKRIYLIGHGGDVETITIPIQEPNKGDGGFYVLTKRGILYRQGNEKVGGAIYPGGVYLSGGGSAKKLYEGEPGRATISPDGCKVAITFRTEWEKNAGKKFGNLKMIDLCAEGRKQ